MKRHVYTEDEINAALVLVEAAKARHPQGFEFLGDLGLPWQDLVAYALLNADAHIERLRQDGERVIYAAAWLNGLAVGSALGEGER